MKQKRESGGFFLCFGINLLMHSWWLAVGLLLLGLHYWAGWPLWLNWVAGGIWVLHSLLVTLFISWGRSAGAVKDPPRENKNPYSAKSETMFPQKKE